MCVISAGTHDVKIDFLRNVKLLVANFIPICTYIYPYAKLSWEHDTRLDRTREQGLQDALVNVGSSDVRETSWTASCWFALAPQERDEAMMLSQLTFRESESLTKAGAAREEST